MSTTLPHGIIQINEGNISWYGDITANWQLIDSKIGVYDAAVATIPAPANNGTLTINYGGTTIAMFGADDAGNVSANIPAPGDGTLTVTQGGSTLGTFSANQATDETINITVPDVNNGILTIQQNGTTVDTFTANSSSDKTVNIQCVDLSSAQTVAGIKTFTSSPGVSRTNDPYYHLTTTGYNKGTSPASNLFSGVRFFCNPDASAANKITGGLNMAYYANGYNAVELNARNYDENDNHRFFSVSLRVSNDSTVPIDFVPSVSATINLGSSAAQWNNAYIKSLTINGTPAGDILTHNASEFVQVSDLATDADMAEMAETWSI